MSGRASETVVVDLVVVAHDCAGSLAPTLASLPARELRSVVVVDAGSTDATPLVARDAGAVLLHERSDGYGAACRRAIAHLESLPRPPDAVVLMAGDGSDDPADIPALLAPIRSGGAELVVGVAGGGAGAADRMALGLIGLLYRQRFGGLGAFRAVRFPALVALGLSERGDAWNVEMTVKGVRLGLRIAEVPVSPRVIHLLPGSRAAELRHSVSSTSRMLFQILRHATAR
ncbi:MAG TPA: glycosyltransferase [Kofleriaceae bacterium]|nr:glycosyltransferase [Kofleriaceae bacterium]